MSTFGEQPAAALDRWAEAVNTEDLTTADTEGLRQIAELAEQRDEIDNELLEAVKAARRSNLSWSEIGAMLGVSKQAAQPKYGTPRRSRLISVSNGTGSGADLVDESEELFEIIVHAKRRRPLGHIRPVEVLDLGDLHAVPPLSLRPRLQPPPQFRQHHILRSGNPRRDSEHVRFDSPDQSGLGELVTGRRHKHVDLAAGGHVNDVERPAVQSSAPRITRIDIQIVTLE